VILPLLVFRASPKTSEPVFKENERKKKTSAKRYKTKLNSEQRREVD